MSLVLAIQQFLQAPVHAFRQSKLLKVCGKLQLDEHMLRHRCISLILLYRVAAPDRGG